MDAPPHDFQERHDHVAAEDVCDRVFAERGGEPDRRGWSQIASFFPADGPILEIGPGTGHLLAAAKEAGREAWGVDTNPVHRRIIRERWGVEHVCETLAEIPTGQLFAGAIMINVLEHMYDPASFLRLLTNCLRGGGGVFISTVNGASLTASVARARGPMFKPEDHVSFPSPHGMRVMAGRAGLLVDRVWTHELPLETPLALAIALRDWLRERRDASVPEGSRGPTPTASGPGGKVPLARRVAGSIHGFGRFDPLAPVIAAIDRASSVKGVIRKPAR
jgi:SAM-dependent methyltransferase